MIFKLPVLNCMDLACEFSTGLPILVPTISDPMKLISFILAFCLILAGEAQSQADFKKLDAYYSRALKDWAIPGMSIAIVKDGKVVFSKGYGVKEAGKSEPPDENTLYAIASNTKAFTATAIAQLVEAGKLDWNDPVKKYIPYFELYDPWVSQETTIRDLLSHRVGLGTFSGDLIWYRSTLNAEEIIKRVKYLPKAYGFRSGYGYSNVMYVTAGEVIRSITGKTWGENMKESFFQPLGMSRTISTTKEISAKGNAATPHAFINGQHKPIAWEDWETIAAMGGIISSVKDMSQWMIFNLNHGIWNGDTLLSAQSRNILWTPHNTFVVDHTGKEKSTHFRGYGLGWGLNDYRGRLRVGHTGGYTGMVSGVALIPDENLGIVVLTNGMKSVFAPLINYTIDAFLKAPEKDWSAESLANLNKSKDTRIEDRKKARVLNSKPSLPSDGYSGTFNAESYGKINVKTESGKLKIYFEYTPDLTATLEHWHYNVYEMKWDKPDPLTWFPFATVQFELDNNNEVTGISFDVPNDDFWFQELKAKKVH
jgi:CubicO group peptidase (beta-lactamase class C family)